MKLIPLILFLLIASSCQQAEVDENDTTSLNTKSRLVAGLVFAVGIGYADITIHSSGTSLHTYCRL
jgi:hypothetical protein